MRQAIKQQLIAALPALAGRCYELHEVTAATTKPYLIMRYQNETKAKPWNGFRQLVEITACVAREDGFAKVDRLLQEISVALKDKLLQEAAGEGFSCQYQGKSGDLVESTNGLLTRSVQFTVEALVPVPETEVMENDSWLESLLDFSRKLLGEDWLVCGNFWSAGVKLPAVMWRIISAEVLGKNPGGYQVQKKIVGHVLGRTKNEQVQTALRLVEELGRTVKLPLEGPGEFLTIKDPAVNYLAEPVERGQITLTLTRYQQIPEEVAPLMRAIHESGNMKIRGGENGR